MTPDGQVPDFGLTLDTATAPWQSADPKMLAAIRDYMAKADEQQAEAQQPGFWGKAFHTAAEVVHLGDPVFKALSYPYHLLSSEVISPLTHIPLVVNNQDWQRQIGADSKWDALFDARSWSEINRQGEKESWGRGIALDLRHITETMSHPEDIGKGMTDAELAKWRKGDSFKYVSGAYDAVGWIFFDPLIATGKVAKAVGLFQTTRPASRVIDKSEDFDEILSREPVRKFLTWTDGKSSAQIAERPEIRNSPGAGLVADLLSKASHEDKGLIYRLGLGDQKALDQLQREAPQVAAQLERLRGEHRYLNNLMLPAGLSRAERKDVLAQGQTRVNRAAANDAVKLRLGRTEFNPGRAGVPVADDPFGVVYSNASIGVDEARKAYTTVYDNAYVAEDSTKLFRPGEAVPRTPQMVQGALDELESLHESARLLTDRRTGLQAQRATQSFPKGTSKAERADMAAGSGYKYNKGGEPKYRLYTSDELANVRTGATKTPADQTAALWHVDKSESLVEAGAKYTKTTLDPNGKVIRTQTRKGARFQDEFGIQSAQQMKLPLDGAQAGMADDLGALMHSASVEGFPATRYPMYHYDPAEVTEVAEQIKGQTNILDDLISPEIGALDRRVGGILSAMNAAQDIVNTPVQTGIFGQLDRLPKRGLYGSAAGVLAGRRYAANSRYERGFGQLRQLGWLNRPVYVAEKFGSAITRSSAPTVYTPNDPEAWRALDSWIRSVKGFPAQDRMQIVKEHMGLIGEGEKLAHVERAEAAVMEHMMRRHGITDDQLISDIVIRTLGKRQAVVGRMADEIRNRDAVDPQHGSSSGAYSGAVDGMGIRVDALERDGTATVVSPMLRTQLLNNHPLLPVDELNRALWRDRHMFRGSSVVWGTKDNIMEFSQIANKVWKGSVLARFGYPFRTVSDEALMSIATMDALTYMSGAISGPMNMVRNLPGKAGNARKWEANRRARELGKIPEEIPGKLPARRGEQTVNVGGIRARGIFQGPRGDIYRQLTSTDQKDLWGVYDDNLAKLRTHASWGVLDPSMADDHLAAWQHALTMQFGKDELARRALAGHDVDQMVGWLKTPAGRQYASRNALMSGKRRDWAQSVHAMVDQYTVGMPELRKAALGGQVDLGLLKAVPMELRPSVHGGQIDYTLGLHGWHAQLNRLLNGFYHVANKVPTDTLVRHPVADLLYQRRLRELVASAKAQGYDLTQRPDRLYQMEEISRQWTVKQMHLMFKDHLFDSPQTALRFMMPFFGAWRGAIARWGRAIGEDPSVMARMNSGWQGLHKPFDLVDENGVPVDDHEQSYGVNTKNAIMVRLPKWAIKQLKIPYAPAVSVPLKSFNTIIQGDPWYNPGFGPLVTIPVSEIVRNRPELANSKAAKFVLPFGARSVSENLLPTLAQRELASKQGLDNRGYAMAFVNIYRTEIMRFNMGQREKPPSAEEIRKKAGHLMNLRKMASAFLPVSVTPMHYDKAWEGELPDGYQFLAGKFRDYREQYGTDGEEKFLQEFPEAWPYLESTSRNVSGIPANIASWNKSKRVKDLMKVAPDIFPSVANIREWNRQGFDRSVYDAQFNSEFNPNTGENMREPTNALKFYTDAKVGQGWRLYSQAMELIHASMEERSIQSLEDPHAKDLKDAKQAVIQYVGEQYPEWSDEYSTGGDPAKRRRVLQQAEIITQDKRFLSDTKRPDIQGLAAYVYARKAIAEVLQARDQGTRGSLDLTAKSNADVFRVWNQIKDSLNADPMYAELWGNRYFAHDNLQELIR